MFPRLTPARRHRSPVAVRMIAFAGLMAIVAALAFGSLHAPGTDASMAASGMHAVANVDGADASCATCAEPDEGVMAACLMVLVVVAMLVAPRGMPALLETRIPARSLRWAPRTIHRATPPRLDVLCICRT